MIDELPIPDAKIVPSGENQIERTDLLANLIKTFIFLPVHLSCSRF